MAANIRTCVRASLVVSGILAAMALTSSPASADTHRDDGDQPGTLMSASTAVLLFVGIPLLVAATVWLLASAPGWTRGGRVGATGTATFAGDPLVVDGSTDVSSAAASSAAADSSSTPAIEVATGLDVPPGGTSATW